MYLKILKYYTFMLRLLKSVLFIFRQEKSTPVFYRSIFVTVGVYVEALLNPLCVRLI